MRIRLLTLAAAFAVASGGVVLADIQPAAAAPQSFTVHISNNQDDGHHNPWALLDFDRTITFTPTPGVTGEYQALLTDKGTFKTIDGALSPREGAKMTEQTGTFTGHFSFTVDSPKAPSMGSVKASYDYRCDGKDNDRLKSCAGMPASTSNWPALFVGGTPGGGGKDVSVPDTVKIKAGDYSWVYTTCAEQWTDASANSDGTASDAGDITGKACPPSPTPTDTGSPPAAEGGGGSLPATGTSVLLLVVVGGVLILAGGVAMGTSRRRGRMH